MMDEMELDRQKALQGWDAQSCAEFAQFLDNWIAQDNALNVCECGNCAVPCTGRDTQEPAPIPCTCYYTDVDVVENRYCEAHNRRSLGEF